MSVQRWMSFAMLSIGILLAGAARAADAPAARAASAAELVVKLADAIEGGDVPAVKSCLDLTTDAARDYAEYLSRIAEVRGAQAAVLKLAEAKFGAAVRAKAEPLVAVERGPAGNSYALLKELPARDLKEGGKFYPPGFKGEATFVKRDGGWVLDVSQVLDGVNKPYLKGEMDGCAKTAAEFRKAADSATSGDDLLAKLEALKKG